MLRRIMAVFGQVITCLVFCIYEINKLNSDTNCVVFLTLLFKSFMLQAIIKVENSCSKASTVEDMLTRENILLRLVIAVTVALPGRSEDNHVICDVGNMQTIGIWRFYPTERIISCQGRSRCFKPLLVMILKFDSVAIHQNIISIKYTLPI